jgi:hypothetical protein
MTRLYVRDFWENKGRYKRHLDREITTGDNGQQTWTPLAKYGEKYPKDAKAEKLAMVGAGGSEQKGIPPIAPPAPLTLEG